MNEQSSEEMIRSRMLVGGQWVDSLDGRTIAVENPANRQTVGEVPRGSAPDVDAAVTCARSAFGAWSKTNPRERARLLLRIADDIQAQAESIARIQSLETGNALRTQTRGEAATAAEIFRYFGGLAGETKGETIPLGDSVLSYTRREPVGVVGAIVPWNAPVSLSSLKIAPAVAAGNPIVLKAAEDAPLAVLELARICQAHLPPGVVNVVTGYGPEAGAALAAHPGVAKLSFTGSTEVGKRIMHAAAERIVPVSLELGGKSPSIVYPDVLDDASDDWAIDGVMASMRFTRQSQSCTAGSRLFLHRSIHDAFLAKLAARAQALRIGDPLDEASDVGTLINGKQFRRVCDYIEDGLQRNPGRVICGGLPPSDGPLSKGWYTIPTIITDVSPDWRLAREEIFGPVLVVIPWEDEAEVIRMANDSHYGLAAYVFSRDLARGLRAAHAIESGWVQVNQGTGQSVGQPYGGFKQSGIGREFSLDGMLESFTRVKAVTVNLAV
jgi:acyl-CoA reductase-like NAD-dependent aldehyde dehydrogenase